jgi:hypothetical protein
LILNKLSIVFVFKIAVTVIFWCVPLLLLPGSLLESLGFPQQSTHIFIHLLGWAYLSLVVGYYFGLRESWKGRRAIHVIWVGIVSNGGACLFLTFYGLSGAWNTWGDFARLAMWTSVGATGLITLGLILFGLRDNKLPTV